MLLWNLHTNQYRQFKKDHPVLKSACRRVGSLFTEVNVDAGQVKIWDFNLDTQQCWQIKKCTKWDSVYQVGDDRCLWQQGQQVGDDFVLNTLQKNGEVSSVKINLQELTHCHVQSIQGREGSPTTSYLIGSFAESLHLYQLTPTEARFVCCF